MSEPNTAKNSRADQARINGAKSKGPRTATGRASSQTANWHHGLYAIQNHTLPTESPEAYEALRSEIRAFWLPFAPYLDYRVERLVRCHWELRRLDQARHAQLLHLMDSVRRTGDPAQSPITIHDNTISTAAGPSTTVHHIDAKIDSLERLIARLEVAILRLRRNINSPGSTQMSLITKEQPEGNPKVVEISQGHAIFPEAPELPPLPPDPAPPEPQQPQGILDWAATKLNFTPDPHQAELLTSESKNVLMLCARQTGKSTAAAVRVVYEAVHFANETILLAGPTGRQSGQIMIKARHLAESELQLKLGAPPPGCDGFRLPNGSYVISLPDSEKTIRGFSAPRLIIVDEAAFADDALMLALQPMLAVSNGALILLSTPNGQSGFFYEQWHSENSPWTKILLRAADCARVNQELLQSFSRTMSREDFNQEFNCEFTPARGQFISRELYRSCLRDDIPIFLPELEFDPEFNA